LGADGIHAVSWLPLAYPRRTIQNSQREIDIAYVGSTNWSMYPERGLLLESIAENFENVLIKECLPSEMFEIYERSKIVFNFSPMNDVNMRFFEALGSGAVLITNPIFNNGIEEIFSTNIDFVEYQSSEHLISLIKNLLADPKEMLEISSNGVTKVREHHTYHNRCIDIAQTFKQIDPDNRKVSNLDTSAALISMNMLAPALKYFFKAIRGESTGKRSRIMLLILNPVFISLVTIFSFIEFVLRQFRKTKW
jgi:hypothetical protein